MCRFKCAECGKELPSLVGCWWRHYYQDIEILCPKCARACDGYNLMSADVIPPRLLNEVEG